MFFLKIKGTEKVQDFVQIRDENFNIIDIIKISILEKKIPELLTSLNLKAQINNAEKIIELIKNEQYGKIQKIEF